MIEIRKASDRGRSRFDWLDSRHSFSFGSYFDRENLGFGTLRVVNEDWIAPGRGFGPHPHRDMEILTYVLAGELAHRDGEGNTSIVRPGRAQLMRAGRGIVHSEMNASDHDAVHLYQIWIHPETLGLDPAYTELDFVLAPGEATPIATPHGTGGGLAIDQDASIHASRLEAAGGLERTIAPGRSVWIQVAAGSGEIERRSVEAGDGVALVGEADFTITTQTGLEVLIFDLP